VSGELVQSLLAGLIVALALAWLIARRVRAARRGARAACEHCPAASGPPPGVRAAPVPEILLSIGEPAPPARPRR
jgi:hypothetical protein